MAQVPNKYGDNDWKNPEGAETTGGKFDAKVGGLLSYCVDKIKQARDERDERYEDRWAEYTRIWRGFWTNRDKNTDSERSRLISPATMQAIEMTVAEMEEATFARQAWFDVEDDLEDEEKDDAVAARDLLLEEFEINDVASAVTTAYLLGAIYGTGIGKINTQRVREYTMGEDGQSIPTDRLAVTLIPIRPDQFVIDTSALTVDEAHFCAHQILRPRHLIIEKQKAGLYMKGPVGIWTGETDANTDGTDVYDSADNRADGVLVTEYFGKVPADMLKGYDGDEEFPEAIITIANESTLLKAVPSPFTMKDRPVIAYAHDTVPGEFFGRGITEKGFNPQKALDAELRARIDALAITNAPMIGADITRLPRSPDMRIRPGKTVFTRGNPKEVFAPMEMGSAAVLQGGFQHAADMERMVTMATGAMDSAAPLNSNRRNETASGMSMMGSGFIKRSKRAMGNVERNFLQPLIQKSLWRYMQFDPARFGKDVKFVPKATMGIMAKEVENGQLIQMLGFLEAGSQEYKIIIKAIFDNSASANKVELNQAMQAMTAPPTPEEEAQQKKQAQMMEQMAQIELQQKQKDVEKTDAETKKLISEANKNDIMADLEDDKVDIQAANAVTGAEKARMGHEQNEVARDRNEVERLKARSNSTVSGDK